MRCSWVNLNNKLYVDYHDKEWGKIITDDNKLFEMLILEIFQTGLSWEIILNKRDNFRKAFDNFNYYKISKYDKNKVNELLNNKGIIRNKNKILATINNAKIFIEIRKEYKTFYDYIWHFANYKVIYGDGTNNSNDLSDIISIDLKKRKMKFVGTKVIYAYLQALGVIYDHMKCCEMYKNS